MPADLPSTIQRSPEHAQDLYAATLASAVKQYGDGERAHRTAIAALKNEYEKVGDHWERKATNGPSGPQEGVDAAATKAHLLALAKRLDVAGRSRMTKPELIEALKKANARSTRQSG